MITLKANTKTEAKARVRFSMLLVFVDWLRFIYLFCSCLCKGGLQKLLSRFCPLRGYPTPPTPLNGKSFFQKTLSGKSAKLFLKIIFLKGLKTMFLY